MTITIYDNTVYIIEIKSVYLYFYIDESNN